MTTPRPRARTISVRWLLAICGVVTMHALIVLGLGSTIPDAADVMPSPQLHFHATTADDSTPATDGNTPLKLAPEVRSLGMSEHEWVAPLPSLPGVVAPPTQQLAAVGSTNRSVVVPDTPAVAGRAPPRI